MLTDDSDIAMRFDLQVSIIHSPTFWQDWWCRAVKHSHSTVMFRELLARPCSFSARQRYCPSPCGVISMISSTDNSSAVMVPTSSPSFSQVRVGAGLPWVLQCRASEVPSCTVIELFTRGSRGGSATKNRDNKFLVQICINYAVKMFHNTNVFGKSMLSS